jgi:hypothetical protein
MQRVPHRCPRCDQPLGISWDMWGKYYLCGGCGFTAEDDDELNGKGREAMLPPASELIQEEVTRLWQASSKRQ